MSLDVDLVPDKSLLLVAADYLQEGGFESVAQMLRDLKQDPYYEANITHNLGEMADAVGLYRPLWRPEEIGIQYAHQLIPLLEAGLARLIDEEEACCDHSPSNGWGTYEGLVEFVSDYLAACQQHPYAVIEVSR